MELARVVKRRNIVMIILLIAGFLQGSLSTGGSLAEVIFVGLFAGIFYAAITYVVFSIYIYFYKILGKP
ncbi:hypothetical protein ACFP65_00130 [Marinilactibacillus sp. GCM10026970]|uniref:hypothetical protein n=1 Tax=Marinilactibacillus sp. GCM10026970 TaxID=3252642 RepID=UPI00361E215F